MDLLKKGTESVVDRIFITGVAPITLDSLTSGFNIGKDLTRDFRFNEMLGFTKDELLKLLKEQNIQEEQQEEIIPVMKENYDGYKFSIDAEENIYNSNMCLFFLNEYLIKNEIPSNLIDVNIASDYSKLEGLINLCTGESKKEILESTLTDEGIITRIIEKFNPKIGFGEQEFVSMLFYLGYLTIKDQVGGYPKLGIPNKTMKDIYGEYFLNVVATELEMNIEINYAKIGSEMLVEGKINNMLNILHKYLNNLSNRDYIQFNEKLEEVKKIPNLNKYTVIAVNDELYVEKID